ncbi:EF-hand [Xylaria nigripes]|nr:EF-hand [Xylaria nigripes]
MAYNRPMNPDELPRFTEPDEVRKSDSRPPPSHYHQPKPQPPAPGPGSGSYHHDSFPSRKPGSSPGHTNQHPHPRPQHSYTHYGSMSHASMSPPPQATGPRPSMHARPPAPTKPPSSPDPRDVTADPTLLPLFRAVDKNGTGQLSEGELAAALVNGDWTAFDSHTVRMMIRMFDTDRSGTIGFDEFCGLWSFLASWRTLFDRFDTDRSGNISIDEFSNALVAFRYRLSPEFVELLFNTYDKRSEGVMSFDLFVQACISLKRMTDVFKKYDDDRDGYITLGFEDFLVEILKQLK